MSTTSNFTTIVTVPSTTSSSAITRWPTSVTRWSSSAAIYTRTWASPAELGVNARIAVNLGAPVVLAIRAKDRTAEQVVHAVEVCLAELNAQHAHTAAVIANRCEPTQLTAITEALRTLAPKTYAVPDEPLLVAPTVADLQAAVDGTLVSGDTALMSREVMGVVVAGMTADHVLERLGEAAAVVTPGDRSDVVLAVASAHAAEGFPSLACIILNGGFELHQSTGALVAGLRLRLPIIATTLGTFDTATAVGSARGRVTATSQRKIDTAMELIESHVDLADLLAQLAIPIPKVTTPQMFTYQLRERARSDRKRIVLPEGDDDRILKSAGRVLQRGIADLTILGDESQIRSRAAELGVNVDDAAVFESAHQRSVRPVRRAVRPASRQKGCHRRAGPRDHARRVVFRHHAGAQRHGRRHGVRCSRTPPPTLFARPSRSSAPPRAYRRCPVCS